MRNLTRLDLAGTGFTIAYLAAMTTMVAGTIDALPHSLFRPLALFVLLPAGIVGVAMIVVGNRGWHR